MTRKAMPSSAYPKEFLDIFMHVLNTNAEVIVDTLGKERSKYTTMRHKMNMWRSQMDKENNPIAKDLMGVIVMMEQRKSDGQFILRIAPRALQHAQALKGLVPSYGPRTGVVTPDVPEFKHNLEEEGAEPDTDASSSALNDIFNLDT